MSRFPSLAAVVSLFVAFDRAAVAEPPATIKDWLATPAVTVKAHGPLLSDNLKDVPELHFVEWVGQREAMVSADNQMLRVANRIRELNAKHADGFILALRQERPDLGSLPLALGDACRSDAERARYFKKAAELARNSLRNGGEETFWTSYEEQMFYGSDDSAQLTKAQHELMTRERFAALMQVLGTESVRLRLGLIQHLGEATNTHATRHLATLAVFSNEKEVRDAAIKALDGRRQADYTDVLLKGLRYPWPPVIQRAADAAAQLKHLALTSHLAEMLDEPDPRSPFAAEIEGKKATVVRELVRINHTRSCLLCHAPTDSKTPTGVLTAAVMVPGFPFGPIEYYQSSPRRPSQMVRLDMTYIRQDFAATLPERYDFVVQQRALSADEEPAFRDQLAKANGTNLAPHRRSALEALRQLTGKDAPPNAQAWREVLKTP